MRCGFGRQFGVEKEKAVHLKFFVSCLENNIIFNPLRCHQPLGAAEIR